MKLKTAVRSLFLAASLVGSIGVAQAFPQFTVQEGAIPGAFANAVTGDELKGTYIERVSGDFIAGSFVTAGVFNITSITLGGTNVDSQLGSSAFNPNLYLVYALFEFSGGLSVNAAGDIKFTPTVGSISIYADPLSNSSQVGSYTESTAGFVVNPALAADDQLLGSTSTLIGGSGNARIGANSGDFAVTFDALSLTPLGQSYFIDPVPFYLRLRADGNFTSFTPNPTFPSFTESRVTGSGQVQLPEPASLGLLGLVFAGLGAVGLRRRNA